MAREEVCILINMCMVYDGNRILVQDRRNLDWREENEWKVENK